MKNDVLLIVMIVGIVAIAFLLLREVLLWYWKINEIVQNQKKTNYLLAKILYEKGGELTDDEKKWLELE
jgi:hypothetical protein